uniref:Uncharacterized protein n=1 Tax=Sus scrofa TaxID=9823 RepID=A0A4X1SJ21_PIG
RESRLRAPPSPSTQPVSSSAFSFSRLFSPSLYENPWSLPCPASQGNSNLQALPAVLCPLPGLASLPWLPQELEPLSRMPFGSGQVSPAAFPAGHAMHPPELMCSIIYSHGARPARKKLSSAEARSPRQLTARGVWGRLLLGGTWEQAG